MTDRPTASEAGRARAKEPYAMTRKRVARLDGGVFDVAPRPGAEAMGGQVAQAAFKGLTK